MIKTVGLLCLVVCAVMSAQEPAPSLPERLNGVPSSLPERLNGVPSKAELYLVNANLVDPAAREVRRGNLLIRDGRIASAPAKPPADFKGRTLDLSGKWVIPGLVDLHTHTYGNVDTSGTPIDRPNPPGVALRMLYAGVTAFLDLFGAEEEQFTARAQQRAGVLGGADMFSSLSCITATGAHGTEYGVKTRIADSPEQARQAIESLKARRPDVIKIIYEFGSGRRSIHKSTFLAAVSAAKENGIKTVVHVSTWQDVRDAVEAGATAVTHTPAGPVPEDLARLMASRRVASIPTLAVQTDFRHFVLEPGVLDNPMARALTTAAVVDTYRSAETRARVELLRERLESGEASAFHSVKAMSDAGVQILAGTDSGSVGTLQGYSLHRELIQLVAAGLSPWQALAAATTDAAAFLGRSYGVKPGSEATLVVLDASPVEDIRNTQRIAYVIHHGVVVDREGLGASRGAGVIK
jgi:imidazolonepropionase-like amidohydrolase